jgi:hypothetical protein
VAQVVVVRTYENVHRRAQVGQGPVCHPDLAMAAGQKVLGDGTNDSATSGCSGFETAERALRGRTASYAPIPPADF